jgi:hypothetical protein
MTDDDEFRRQAAEAQIQASKARSDYDREAWLRIAQSWMGLLRKRPQSDAEADAFEDRSAATKTTDRDSDTSH